MEFLYPSFLWALGILAIPIIIHLFYFRRFKRVEFSNVRMLKEIKEETASRSKLKNLLVLLSRLLAIAALVFAFAQPFLSDGKKIKKGNNAVSVFVDNSFSMNATQNDIPLIDIAKEKAREIVNAYSDQDQIQILTHDFEGRHQRLVSKEDALALVDQIEPSPEVKSMDLILARQAQALNLGEENKVSFIVSDFQRSVADTEAEIDTSYELNLVPIQTAQEANITIDSAWFDSPVAMPNQNNKLNVRITNYSDDVADGLRLSLTQGQEEKPLGSLSINARATIEDTVNISFLKTGYQDAILKISDYPVQFDDTYYLSFYAKEKISVLSINEASGNRYISAMFEALPTFNIINESANQVKYDQLGNNDLVILNDLSAISSGLSSELTDYVMEGGNLLIFPSKRSDIDSYNRMLGRLETDRLGEWTDTERKVNRVNTDEFVFSEVYLDRNRNNLKLPTTQGNFNLSGFQSASQERLLTYRDGKVMLAKYAKGRGNVYLSSAPLDNEYNDIAINAEIFVPMLYKMALASGVKQEIAYTIGKDEVITIDHNNQSADLVYHIKGASEFIPAQTNAGNTTFLTTNNQIRNAGFYDVTLGEQRISRLAYNYDRKESDLRYMSADELRSQYEDWKLNVMESQLNADIGNMVKESNNGIPLWRWCVILALVFLAIEQLLLRFWKS